MAADVCRWGILGTAGIARKNWHSIWNADNATLGAVASRSQERAETFISECQAEVPFTEVPVPCGSYEELLARDDIDAVYIPLPTGLRKEWVCKAAEAGKHVLAEKPVGNNAGEVAEMVGACEKAGVQFMDGVMYMHSDRLPLLRSILDDGETVGELRRITTQFSFNAPPEFLDGNIRVHSDLESLGCVGDLGWYTIRFALFVMNWEVPVRVAGRLLRTLGRPDSPNSVPIEFSGELFFANGVTASFYNSFVTHHQQLAHVSGTKGFIELNDFVLPYVGNEIGFQSSQAEFEVTGCQSNMADYSKRYAVAEYGNNHPSAQETKLFRTFSQLVLAGTPDRFWPEVTLKTQQVLDACLDSARQEGAVVTI